MGDIAAVVYVLLLHIACVIVLLLYAYYCWMLHTSCCCCCMGVTAACCMGVTAACCMHVTTCCMLHAFTNDTAGVTRLIHLASVLPLCIFSYDKNFLVAIQKSPHILPHTPSIAPHAVTLSRILQFTVHYSIGTGCFQVKCITFLALVYSWYCYMRDIFGFYHAFVVRLWLNFAGCYLKIFTHANYTIQYLSSSTLHIQLKCKNF